MLFPIQWNEPFGLVMIEAMACGTPVLALPGGAVEEDRTRWHLRLSCATPSMRWRNARASFPALFNPANVRQYCQQYFSAGQDGG